MKNKVILVVLDGFGYREGVEHNAIARASTPFWDSLIQNSPHSLLDASGLAVGLPEGQIGSSEVGHMTIGAGKALDTDLVRINKSIASGDFARNAVFHRLFDFVKIHDSTLHVFGLVSPGGVHSHMNHLREFLKLAAGQGVEKIALHGFTDGRDVSPMSGAGYMTEVEDLLKELSVGHVASLTGRYYAMDRDQNWDRVQRAASALFECKGEVCHVRPSEKLKEKYEQGISDEFVEPLVFLNEGTDTPFREHDAAFFFNFRADRARQLAELVSKKMQELHGYFATLTEYSKDLPVPCAFPPEVLETTLSNEISKAGLSQVHIAETEKYAHATYFLNGSDELPHAGEIFVLVDSRKDIATHDLAPEMKAKEITDKAIEYIHAGADFIFINYANADMVGHTGNEDATVKAIECLDVELKRLCEVAEKHGIPVVITADHGNAEHNFNEEMDTTHTAHTANPVPLVIYGVKGALSDGTLADVAPTVLKMLGLEKPVSMSGNTLLTE